MSTSAYGALAVTMFGMVVAQVKMNASGAHTFLEVCTTAHIVFTIYTFTCVLVVCGSLLVGGAATVSALAGMNILAAYFLLPIGIAVYVVFGGLRATFICDWTHTITILFVIIYTFIFRRSTHVSGIGTSPEIGSLARMYQLLTQAAIDVPVPDNANGSYVTMKSRQGLVFGASALLSGFADMFCDQGMTIASHPKGTTKAYHNICHRWRPLMVWFTIPWAFGSCLGLTFVYDIPFPLSPQQTSAGLAAPAAAAVLMGKGGAMALLLVVLVFMAVTSAASAELIAVSRIHPRTTGAEIVRVSHYAICAWTIWMGCWATISNSFSSHQQGMGIVLSPAVIPIILMVWWPKLTRAWLLCGSIIGAILGMLAWMIGCWKVNGAHFRFCVITIANLALPISAVSSGLTGFMFFGLITVFVSLWSKWSGPGLLQFAMLENSENNDPDSDVGPTDPVAQEDPLCHDTLQRVFSPVDLFFTDYMFSERFYTFWVTCSIGTFGVILPLLESRKGMAAILKRLGGLALYIKSGSNPRAIE
ncbi:putative urea transporter [Suillus placidus]|uniref:Urea transporter n=1 Tax=Suillus placidus TaxID=48579 RepID=A0A9P7A5M5_9AGAM|nr:putative urea transporter [Suillus placidus]